MCEKLAPILDSRATALKVAPMPLPDHIVRIHDAACRRRDAGYVDPASGLFVLTAHYLAERGYCCGTGCRHCPYSVEEQKQAGRPTVKQD